MWMVGTSQSLDRQLDAKGSSMIALPPPPRVQALALTALALAMLGFLLILSPALWLRVAPPVEKPIAASVRDSVTALGSSVSSMFGTETQQPSQAATAPMAPWPVRIEALAALLAIGSIMFAAAAYVRRQDGRCIAASIALASATLAYGFELRMLLALFAALLVLFLLGRNA